MKTDKKAIGVFCGEYGESLIIKSLLESHQIVFFAGSFIQGTLHTLEISTSTLSTINVLESDFARARHILEVFNDNLYNLEV